MRTIQIINVRWFNATAWYGLYLAKLLQEAGHESIVMALEGTASAEKAREWGFDPVCLDFNTNNPVKSVVLYGQMKRVIDRFQPHIVNCHRGEAFVHWGLLRKQTGRFKLVRTRGDQRLPKNNFPNRWLHDNVADAVVATNSVMANHFVRSLGVRPEKVHTILGGVDAGRFTFDEKGRQQVRDELGYTDEHFAIGLLGRFDEVKGQQELVEAVAKLYHGGMKNLRLMLLGFDSALPESTVRGWIAENHVEDIVTITGKRPDVTACLSALDTGVIASKWSETIARAALEIMACNRPLISTDVGVMPDLLTPDALFAKGDVQALADAIAMVANDAEYRERIRTVQQVTIAGLTGEHFLNKTLDLYSSLLEETQ